MTSERIAAILTFMDEANRLKDTLRSGHTPQGRPALAKVRDKIETMLTQTTGRNPPDFDCRFNLSYGTAATVCHPLPAKIRAQVDARTEKLSRQPA